MLLSSRLWCTFALLAFATMGCSEVTTRPNTAPVKVTVTAWPGLGIPLEDVELCETGTANCELTDANGEATLYLPAGAETSFTRTKADHAKLLLPVVIPEGGTAFRVTMHPEERMATQHENVGSPYPMQGTGMINIQALPSVAGATFELFGATGTQYYTDEELNWRPWPDLTETTTQGMGGFTEVGPGVHRVELGGAAEGCVISIEGWPAPGEGSVRLPVVEGFMTDIDLVCP